MLVLVSVTPSSVVLLHSCIGSTGAGGTAASLSGLAVLCMVSVCLRLCLDVLSTSYCDPLATTAPFAPPSGLPDLFSAELFLSPWLAGLPNGAGAG